MRRLEGRVALVTGGASGLGRTHALALAAEGADVAVFDLGDGHRDAEPGYRLATQSELSATVADIEALGRRALPLTGDVRDRAAAKDAVASTVSELGRLDILVTNAGVSLFGTPWEMAQEDWELQLATNLTGTWNFCMETIPRMLDQEQGRIILTASSLALKSRKQLAGYSATKAGVIGLCRSLALDVAEHGITVNCVCPGIVPSGTNRGLAELHGLDWEAMLEESRQRNAMQVLIDQNDVSRAVVFLASDDARFMTGAVLPVDGGAAIL